MTTKAKDEQVLLNPVQVKIGTVPDETQSPISLWQVDQDPELLTRPKSPELKLNFSGKQSELLNDLYKYSIVPDAKLKYKLDYFYTPYNTKFLLRKHMTFEKPEEANYETIDNSREKKR